MKRDLRPRRGAGNILHSFFEITSPKSGWTHFLQIHNPKQLDKLCSFLLSWIMESQLQLELVYSNRNIWMQNGQTITLTWLFTTCGYWTDHI